MYELFQIEFFFSLFFISMFNLTSISKLSKFSSQALLLSSFPVIVSLDNHDLDQQCGMMEQLSRYSLRVIRNELRTPTCIQNTYTLRVAFLTCARVTNFFIRQKETRMYKSLNPATRGRTETEARWNRRQSLRTRRSGFGLESPTYINA